MYIHACHGMYKDMHVYTCMSVYVHEHGCKYMHVHVYTRLHHIQTCMYHFAKSCPGVKDSRWNVLAGWYHDRSISPGRCHTEVNPSTPSKQFFVKTAQLLLYDCSIISDLFEHRMAALSCLFHGVNITVSAYPQYHDSRPCMSRYSNFSYVTTPCLAYLTLATACCTAVAEATKWHSMPHF
jgi:hypothetical protein